MKGILALGSLIFLYLLISVFAVSGICNDSKLYKFKDFSDDCCFPNLKTVDDKFVFFSEFIFWPILVVFRYIPKLIYIIGKFLVEYIAWAIVKLFKL